MSEVVKFKKVSESRLLDLPELLRIAGIAMGPNGCNDGEHDVLYEFVEWAEGLLNSVGLGNLIPVIAEHDQW